MDAHYHRTENKSGEWDVKTRLPEYWIVNWREFKFRIQPMNFKHTGLFPEQAVNWDMLINTIKNAGRPVSVLNLFAYTGAASIVCAKAGASVTHVDAAKSMIDVSKENAKLNGIDNIRYINEDCQKFVEREIRRGKKYDIVLMDPPSFGRGPKGETWKIEDDIFNFVKLVKGVVADNALLVLINSYTTGLQPTVMANILNCVFPQGNVDAYEIGLPTEQKGIVLPCGCTAITRLND
jgi:23S rRNA (cytosine1962-C5)-methyltransferase